MNFLISHFWDLMFYLECFSPCCIYGICLLHLVFRERIQLILGWVVGSSVAPPSGEQPRPIAPRYKLTFRIGSMMSYPLSETFPVLIKSVCSPKFLLIFPLSRPYWLLLINSYPSCHCRLPCSFLPCPGSYQFTPLGTAGFSHLFSVSEYSGVFWALWRRHFSNAIHVDWKIGQRLVGISAHIRRINNYCTDSKLSSTALLHLSAVLYKLITMIGVLCVQYLSLASEDSGQFNLDCPPRPISRMPSGPELLLIAPLQNTNN